MTHPIDPLGVQTDPLKSRDTLKSIPIRPILLENLTTQTHLIQSLFNLLSSSNPTNQNQNQNVQSLYSSLTKTTSELGDVVDEVYLHQSAYERLMRVKEETKQLEREVKEGMRILNKGIGELQGMVDEGKRVRESIDRSEKEPLSSSTLLSTAQNLSSHTSAPLSALLLPQDKAQYMPWPTEGAMRAGLLFMMGGSMSGVGDLGKIGDEANTNNQSRMDINTQAQPTHIQEEDNRRYDPNAVFQLELNSDSDEDD